jgi:hypothetical protein
VRLGLHDTAKPFEDNRGVVRIGGRDLSVVDLDTGDKVDNVTAMLWGPGSILLADEALLTPEHVDPDASYLVVVGPCSAAKRLD